MGSLLRFVVGTSLANLHSRNEAVAVVGAEDDHDDDERHLEEQREPVPRAGQLACRREDDPCHRHPGHGDDADGDEGDVAEAADHPGERAGIAHRAEGEGEGDEAAEPHRGGDEMDDVRPHEPPPPHRRAGVPLDGEATEGDDGERRRHPTRQPDGR